MALPSSPPVRSKYTNNAINSQSTDQDTSVIVTAVPEDTSSVISDNLNTSHYRETQDNMSISTFYPISTHGLGHGRRGTPPPSRPTSPNPSHFLHLSSIKLVTLENNLLYPVSSLPPPKNAPTIVSRSNAAARDSAELLRRSLLIHNAVMSAEREVRERAERVEREMAFGMRGFMDVRGNSQRGSRGSARESIVEVSEVIEEEGDDDDGIPTVAVRHIIPDNVNHIHSVDEEAWFEQTWRELHADAEAEGTIANVMVVEPDFGDFDDEEEEDADIERIETSVVMPSTILSITPHEFSLDSMAIDDSDITFFPRLIEADMANSGSTNQNKSSHRANYDDWEVPRAPVIRPTLVKDKFYTGLVASRVAPKSTPTPSFTVIATPQTISAPPELESDPESDSDAEDEEECVTPTQDILDDFSSSSMARSPTSSEGDFDHVHDRYASGMDKDGEMFSTAGRVKSTAQRSMLWGRDIYEAGDEAGEW